jgi:uncharacterized protein YbcI
MMSEGPHAAASLGSTGQALGKISQRIVRLHREFYGRGPPKAKSYLSDDLVVVMLRGGFTAAESTLLEGGRGDSVIQQRAEFQEVMGDRFREVVEQELGRKVVATMAAVHQHPDLLSQIFVLEATELLTD